MKPLSQFLRSLVALTIFPVLLGASTLDSTDWPAWRGAQGNGSAASGNYPTKWGTNITWKVALPGKGTSTPIVHRDRLFLTCPAEGQDSVMAFDFTGKLLWHTKIGPESAPRHRTLASSCNASPVTDGKSLFVHFRSGHFASLDLDGKIRWKINLVELYGNENLFWDTGASPALTEDLVIMPRIHTGESWIAAFDKNSGEVRWKTARNYKVPNENDNGYTTPVIYKEGGKTTVLLWGSEHLTAYDAQTGKLLWWVGGFNPKGTGFWPHIATPVIAANTVITPVGRDDRNQAQVHGIKLGGSGDSSATHVSWKREDTGVFVASPVAYKDKVYLLRHRGEVVCLNPTTGQTLWTGQFPEHRTPYYSSPTIANGVLYAAREDGVVFAARIEEKFELLSENPMGERIIAAPVPAANRLFLRGDAHLFCVQSGDAAK